jgi:hypothetical protein
MRPNAALSARMIEAQENSEALQHIAAIISKVRSPEDLTRRQVKDIVDECDGLEQNANNLIAFAEEVRQEMEELDL